MDRRATSGAEVIGNLAARIADANKHIRSAANLNALRGEPSLRTKNAASSALTRKAMTHGDANWIARRLYGELTAATGSGASGRWHVIVLSWRHFLGPRSTTWVAFSDGLNGQRRPLDETLQVAGIEWCSCKIVQWPLILRRPTV